MSDNAPPLEIVDLSVIYGSTTSKPVRAVDEVNLHVAPGEIVGLVGESGSGKSTVALASLGLIQASRGTISISGRQEWTRKRAGNLEARANAQMVFQDPYSSLDPRQTLSSGLAELRSLHRKRTGWISDEELLGKVGLNAEHLHRYPHQLSGGQIQRAVMARALLLRPTLLVADEPTSSLDVSVQAQILRLLLDLRTEHHLSILFISHDLSVIELICDRVYVMLEGRIVEENPTSELFRVPKHPYTQRLLNSVPGQAFLANRRKPEM